MGSLFVLRAVEIALVLQSAQATVFGVVREAGTGEPLAGAVVSLADLNRATSTGADGRYVLRQVPAGPQHLTIRLIGHAPRTLHALVPADGELEINISLERTPVQLTTVRVASRVVVRGVDSTGSAWFPDRSVSIAAIRNHPLLAEPDALQALGGGEVVMRAESPSGVHVRGGASDQLAYLLDGIPVFSPYHSAGVFSAWNPDALQDVRLSSSAPSPVYPDALSGAVEALTRAPGERAGVQGSMSSTQARITVDGPLGAGGAGYLLSLRSTFPGILDPRDEPSYLRGETGDWLAKLELPALGGRLRLLGFESENEVTTAAEAGEEADAGGGPPRNGFDWHSRSLGIDWRRERSGVALRLAAWRAESNTGSAWALAAERVAMAAAREDRGVLAAVGRGSERWSAAAGLRLQWSETSYLVAPDSAAGPAWNVSTRTPVATAFAQGGLVLGRGVEVHAGASLAAGAGDLHVGPRAQVRWRPFDALTLSGSYARLHQFSQSLRNTESVVGNVFPPDIFLGAGAPGVPVARSDQGVVAAAFRPFAGAHLGVQAYRRSFDGLLLVAPRGGAPFTTGAFAVGSGSSRGISVDAAMAGARYAVMASYGLQRVRYDDGGSVYVPDHGATHLFEGGVTVFPTASSSIRVGVAGATGRRTTTATGGFEWESCNLLDEGCEFSGSPSYDGATLGTTALPDYFRVDLSARKHWHASVRGRQVQLTLFGTVTNVFNRRNVLTYARQPSTGELVEAEMRPLAPLVVGLDWRF